MRNIPGLIRSNSSSEPVCRDEQPWNHYDYGLTEEQIETR
jgi:hypothetical protein